MGKTTNYIYDDQGVYIQGLHSMCEDLGIAQYRFPHTYELVGHEYKIVADGKEYVVDFRCRQFAAVNGVKAEYEAIKLEADMYCVLIGKTVFALDLMKNQAAIAFEDGTLLAGAIGGAEAPAFAGDNMVGTNVRWVLGCDRYIRQEFVSADTVKTAWTPHTEWVAENKYNAVLLRDSFYLVSADSGELNASDAPFGTKRVILLEDYERCMTAGVVMGRGFDPIMVTGYAFFEDQEVPYYELSF